MLVVRPTGESSWVLRTTVQGNRTDLTVGRWPVTDLKMARSKAFDLKRKIANGGNPVEERKAVVAAKAQAVRSVDTTRKLFENWQEKQDSSAVYKGNIEAAFMKDVLPQIGSLPPHEVTREQVITILRGIEDRGALVMVRRVRMWLCQMFEFGIDDETRPDLKSIPVPTGNLKSFGKRKARHFPAVTNAADVAPLMRKLRAVTDNFVIRNALLLSAYLWQRPTEIREAVWSEFDLDQAIWVIPAERMKLEGEHWIPLAPQVVQMLRVYQGIVGSEGHLFPGRKYGSPISEGTLTSRLNTMGYLGKHSPHGFRAMARTVLDEVLKVDPRFMEKQLSHEPKDSLRGAYNRAEFWDDRVKMMTLWADWLDAQT